MNPLVRLRLSGVEVAINGKGFFVSRDTPTVIAFAKSHKAEIRELLERERNGTLSYLESTLIYRVDAMVRFLQDSKVGETPDGRSLLSILTDIDAAGYQSSAEAVAMIGRVREEALELVRKVVIDMPPNLRDGQLVSAAERTFGCLAQAETSRCVATGDVSAFAPEAQSSLL